MREQPALTTSWKRLISNTNFPEYFCLILPNPPRSTKQWASEDLPLCLLQLPTTMMPPTVWYQIGGSAYVPPTPISLFQCTTWWFINTCNDIASIIESPCCALKEWMQCNVNNFQYLTEELNIITDFAIFHSWGHVRNISSRPSL